MQLLPLLPISYLPPLSYLRLCLEHHQVVIEQHEHFVKQTIRNRCNIYGANTMLVLSVPVIHRDLFRTPVRDVRISYDLPWQKIHWRSIESSYRNSPFFEFYEDELSHFYSKQVDTLFEWNDQLLRMVFKLLNINVEFSYTSSYEENPVNVIDKREYFNTGKPLPADIGVYHQVFAGRKGLGFIPDLSIIDLLFNEGNNAVEFLKKRA